MTTRLHTVRHICARGVLALTALLQSQPSNAQESLHNSAAWEFLPSKTLVRPFLADDQEPRIGLRKEIGSSKLKLDIGGMMDLIELRFGPEGTHRLRAGIDFFTYALTTNNQGLRLQVDAVDGFFGGHVSYRSSILQPYFSLRLRLLHHSSHFVDGHLLSDGVTWSDNRSPVPLTQDFGELTLAHTGAIGRATISPYVGFSYATLSRPVDLKRVNGLAGLVCHVETSSAGESAKPVNVYLADHFALAGYGVYVGTNNVEGGLKFGDWEGPGLRVYASLHSGREIFSQYYDVIRTHWGIGFAADLW